MKQSIFVFENELPPEEAGTLLAKIPPGVTSRMSLFRVLYDELKLPGYFGFNWDALADCLTDLHWVAETTVLLVHRDLPDLPLSELEKYVEVLAESIESWSSSDEKALRVVFPIATRENAAFDPLGKC